MTEVRGKQESLQLNKAGSQGSGKSTLWETEKSNEAGEGGTLRTENRVGYSRRAAEEGRRFINM